MEPATTEAVKRGPGRPPKSRPIVEPNEATGAPPPEIPTVTPDVSAEEPVQQPEPEPPKKSVRFQVNQVQRIQFADHTEYLALPGIHDITDERLIKNLTAYATEPGQKRQIFILTPQPET